ncbi:hypothetical protein MMPV_006354 [Pyropia vietnamensis]
MRLWELEAALGAIRPFPSPTIAREQYVTPPGLAARLIHTAATAHDDIAGRAVADLGAGTGALGVAAGLAGAASVLAVDIDEGALAVAAAAGAAAGVPLDCVVADVLSPPLSPEAVAAADAAAAAAARAQAAAAAAAARAKADAAAAAAAASAAAGMDKEGTATDAAVNGNGSNGGGDHAAATTTATTTAATTAAAVAATAELSTSAALRRHPLAPPPWARGRTIDTVVMNPPFGTRVAGADVAFLLAAAHIARRAVWSMHKASTRAYVGGAAAAAGAVPAVVARLRFPLPRAYAFHRTEMGEVAVDLWRLDVGSGSGAPGGRQLSAAAGQDAPPGRNAIGGGGGGGGLAVSPFFTLRGLGAPASVMAATISLSSS